MLKEKLETLTKEWTSLNSKIKSKLTEKDNTIIQIKQEKQEAIQKLEIQLKENSEDEKVLTQLLKEMTELSKEL